MVDDHDHLIIVGVPKAGTTSLFEYLSQHRDVYPSRVRQTAFFKQADGGRSAYLDEFRGAREGQWLLESTPGYFARGSEVAERIRAVLGDRVRTLVSLRDPVDRFVSHYRMRVRAGALGAAPPPLADYVAAALDGSSEPARNALQVGYYADHLGAWRQVFGPHVRVVFFDRLVADPVGLLEDLCAWLAIDPDAVAGFDLRARNRGMGRRSQRVGRVAQRAGRALGPLFQRYPRTRGVLRHLHDELNGTSSQRPGVNLDPAVRSTLAAHYGPANEQLAQMLERTGAVELPPWLHVDDETARPPTSRPA